MNVIVTGCSINSIGFETAKMLLLRGYNVIITTRKNVETVLRKLEMFDKIDGYHLDLTDIESVNNFVKWYTKKYDRLDILINNAGVHLDLLSQWKEPQMTHDGYEIHWRTNYIGTMHLTLLLIPLIEITRKKYGNVKIIIVSDLHKKGYNKGLFHPYPYNSWIAYGMSKLALIHMTNELQRRDIQSYSIDPGIVSTNISQKGLGNNDLIKFLHKIMIPLEKLLLCTPEDSAKTIVYCVLDSTLISGYYKNCERKKPSDESLDVKVSEQLWNKTVNEIYKVTNKNEL